MKNFKRISAAIAATLIAACMTAPMAMTNVSAAGEGTITITDNSGATSSTMAAFQIFTADSSDAGLVVTGWGSGIDVAKLNENIAASSLSTKLGTLDNTPAGAQAAADLIALLNSDEAMEFARLAVNSTTGSGTTATGSGTTYTVSGLDTGYYVIKDTAAASDGTYTSFSLGMLTVVTGADATATVKRDFPTFDKQIGDINDTDGGDYTFNEAADHDTTDQVPFKLIATVPSNIDKYDTYKMIFHDDIDQRVFSVPTSATVTYYSSDEDTTGTNVTDAFTLAEASASDKFNSNSYTDGTENFTVTCGDITAIAGITLSENGRFEVDYTAELLATANLGATGNWNGAYLEYSNNPNLSGSGDTDNTADSPVDYVVAFTYQTVINKIDGISNEPLSGAEFKLYKEVGGTYQEVTGKLATNTAGTQFVFSGLDDGKYKLEESKTPSDSYNKAADLEFTITAGEIQTDNNEALESLSGGSDLTTGKVYVLDTADDLFKNTGADNGSLSATVKNYKGTSLPATGGIGTTLFYLGGGAMVAVAGVYLISKKRMKSNDEE